MTLEALTPDHVAQYREEGYTLLERRIPSDVILGIKAEIERFRGIARSMTASDEAIDLEDSHSAAEPRIRRIKTPDKRSRPVAELMRSDLILAPVRDLIGPNLRLHTSKLNVKSARYGAAVDWHQDFAFYPHTNDDVLAVGVMLDDVDDRNGPLMVFPGTHRGPIFDHHSGGFFAGTMNLAACGLDPDDAVRITGPAGSISIHHGRIVHGSALNRSDRDRGVVFYEITNVDAFPIHGAITDFTSLAAYDERILCGRPTSEPRLEPVPVRLPQPQRTAYGSIYEIQKQAENHGFEAYDVAT